MSCDEAKGTCSTHNEKNEACPVEKSVSQSCCPIEKGIELWQSSFFQAMKSAQVDILKEKIRKNWGPVLDKEADAVLAAMETHWHSVLNQAKAQMDLKENFKKIYQGMGK